MTTVSANALLNVPMAVTRQAPHAVWTPVKMDAMKTACAYVQRMIMANPAQTAAMYRDVPAAISNAKTAATSTAHAYAR